MARRHVSRRAFLRLAGAACLGVGALSLASCAPAPAAPTAAPAQPARPAPIKAEGQAAPAAKGARVAIRLGHTLSTSTFPLNAGIDRGIFAKYNLEVQPKPYAGFDALYAAYRTGELDMGTGGLSSVVDLHAQGIPVKVIFGNSVMNNDVLVKKESPFQSLGDLKGKKIGVFGGAAGTTANMFMAVSMAYYGFDPRKDAQVQYGAAGLLAGLLEKGDVDAFVSLDPVTTQQLAKGTVRSIGELAQIHAKNGGVHPLAGSINVMDGFAQQHPDAVRNLLKAWLEAVALLEKDLEEWKRLAAAQIDVKDEPTVRRLMEKLAPLWPKTWTEQDVQKQIEALKFVQKYAGTGFLASVPETAFSRAYNPN